MNRIVLVTADLSPGGAERVISTLANNFAQMPDLEVHLVCLIQGKLFYSLDSKVSLHLPNFNYEFYPRYIAYIKVYFYLRHKLKKVKPQSYLSFGGRYNSLCILAGLGLKSKSFISDRSRPGISYGTLFDLLNRHLYPFAHGIIAQTNKAKHFHLSQFKHNNIKIIGNPISDFHDSSHTKKNVILNVGRFIPSKNQKLLIDIFDEVNPENWELWFAGNGPLWDSSIKHANSLKSSDKIKFLGNTADMKSLYNTAKIFAFTSTSEGFPNALGEAMAAGCACVSYDCIAGPSDLIDDGNNGFLIPLNDKSLFKYRLNQMMQPEFDLNKMRTAAVESLKKFSIDVISRKTLKLLLKNGD